VIFFNSNKLFLFSSNNYKFVSGSASERVDLPIFNTL